MSASIIKPTVSQLRTITPHFQRSINVTYDAGDADYIAGYIPTESGANAIASVLGQKSTSHRAHVFHAPYGSGKSLLSLVLGALGLKHPLESLRAVLDRLQRHYPEQAEVVETYYESNQRLLPIFLQGDEGTLREVLLRALTRSVSQLGLGNLRPRTQFMAALNVIERWETVYPDVHQRLSAELETKNSSLDILIEDLKTSTPETLSLFESIYGKLTAGARFDEYAGVKLGEIFTETIHKLKEVDYDGVMIVWDEFGRFMEAKSNQAFGIEAAQLQDFAECCNRSSDNQIHLILVTHRQLATYAGDLPEDYQKEWSRIAERFQTHDITSDPTITYRIISEAIETTDADAWDTFEAEHQDKFRQLAQQTAAYNLFDEARELDIVTQLWPLHPLTAYALPRLTRVAAQNERTLFTFLASDEPNTLQASLHSVQGWSTVNIDTLWNYFANAIRANRSIGGTNRLWSGVIHALSKTTSDEALSQQLIKALGILGIIDDVSVQTNMILGRIVPSTEMLAWAVHASIDDTQRALDALARKRVIVSSRADGYWRFLRGSDVDLDAAVEDLKAQQTSTPLQLRQRLQTEVAPPVHLPRGYNLERHMTRYLTTIYRWYDELTGIGGDEFLKQLHPSYGFADGVVVFVLALNSAQREQAIEAISQLPESRAVFVVPDHPILLEAPLKELIALRELQQNPQFMSQDGQLKNEIAFFVEDSQRRIHRVLAPFFQSRLKQSQWHYYIGGIWQSKTIGSVRQISQLLSQLCNNWFAKTPKFNVEPLNLYKPSKNQSNAAERMIDLLLRRVPDGIYPLDLGIKKSKPERLIVRTMLVRTGLLVGENDAWHLVQPETGELADVWQFINQYLDTAIEDEREVTPLIELLQMPPYGIRHGVLAVVLATAMRPRMKVLTIRQNRRVVTPIMGETFTQLCRRPDDFTIELGVWDPRRAALWATLEAFVLGLLAKTEQEHHPLSYLSLGLLRWLQSQPKYNRDTNTLSAEARELRKLIHKAYRDPTSVLFYDLLELLDDEAVSAENANYQDHLAQRLSGFTSEISSAYLGLLRQLDHFAENNFAPDVTRRQRDGQSALRYWITQIEQEANQTISSVRFSDGLTQRFVDIVTDDIPVGQFWERLGRTLLGIAPSDWNDASVQSFKTKLLQVKEQLQRELFDLDEDEQTIELSVNLPNVEEKTYRFRASDLSQQGKNILANFKTTMAISGRPLSPDEKRQVALAFLHFMLEGEEQGNERKNKSHRVHR